MRIRVWKMTPIGFFLVGLLCCILQCSSSDEPAVSEPIGSAKPQSVLTVEKGLQNGSCHQLENQTASQTVWLNDAGVVLARFLKQCQTTKGEAGYEEKSPFVLMGFPCTGGGGKLEWKGSYYAPRMVSFSLATSCRMNPGHTAQLASQVKETLHLDMQAPLLAYNPFALQYWEVDGSPDADVGYEVLLRSHQGLQLLWSAFQKGEGLKVRLYGRENAWVLGDQFFEVHALLKKHSHNTFKIEVEQLQVLNEDEMGVVQARCEALTPQRRCDHVFGGKLHH